MAAQDDEVELEIIGIESIACVRARADGVPIRGDAKAVGFAISTVLEHEYEIVVRAPSGTYTLELFDRGLSCWAARDEDRVRAKVKLVVGDAGHARVKIRLQPLEAVGLRLVPFGGGA